MRHRNHPLAAPAVLVLAALGLTACEKAQTPTVEPTDTPSAAATALAPSPAATSAAAVTTIPRAMHGRWGLVPADCTSTLGDAKGLLTIDATTLKFYESVAKLGKIKEADEDDIDATYAFTGEGQSWTLDVDLDLEDDGKTLIRKDTGKDAMPNPLKYTRCA